MSRSRHRLSRNYGTFWDTFYQVQIITTYAAIILVILMILGHTNRHVNEDSPAFNCYAHGNRICAGTATDQTWQIFESRGGPGAITKVANSSADFRIEYVGTAFLKPDLDNNMIAVHWEDGMWYVFRAVDND